MEDTDYGLKPELPKPLKALKFILKIFFLALIIFIYGFFMLRICTSEPEQSVIWTDLTVEAYENDKDSFKIYTQEPQVFIDEYDSDKQTGFNLSVFNIYYIPQAKQLQVTVRYNKSALPQIKEKYSSYDPDENQDPFVYSLLLQTGERITGYSYKASKTNRYYFRYLVFDGVDLDSFTLKEYTAENSAVVGEDGRIIAHETDGNGNKLLYEKDEATGKYIVYDVNYIYLDAYYIDNVNFDEEPDACLMIYNRALGTKRLSSSKYGADKGVTKGLLPSPYFVDKTPSEKE